MGQPANEQPTGKEEQKAKPEHFEIAGNPNPRANENIRVRSDNPNNEENDTDRVGSEITDGESG